MRLEDRTVEDMSEDDTGSEVMDGSVVSSVTDKYGFMSGEERWLININFINQLILGESGEMNGLEKRRVDLEIVRRREIKWVEMMASWDTYMMK